VKPYILIERADGGQTIHHESWGKQWITLRPNGEIDVHERKVERSVPKAQAASA
jgi:hypothetical protein